MAKFTVEQATAAAAIQQLINDWADELDINNGGNMGTAGLLTEDCRYTVGGAERAGRAEAASFYAARKDKIDSGVTNPVMRHINSNFRIRFTGTSNADVNFLLLYFATEGTPPFTNYCDPLAVADCVMQCRCDAGGDWRISFFTSSQIFRRS